MNQTEPILVNRVAESDLQTVALDELIESQNMVSFDLKDYLFQGLILKEKDFREALKAYNWADLKDKTLAVYCSADAIIPMWAYMLVSSYASGFTGKIYFGDIQHVTEIQLLKSIEEKDWSYLKGKRVVVKGCSDVELPASAYLSIASKLQPYVQNMMYGEPCSTVPIFKRPRIV
jgi:Protein of unknown function (DUF2480)